jgi:hypothetical protein
MQAANAAAPVMKPRRRISGFLSVFLSVFLARSPAIRLKNAAVCGDGMFEGRI